MPIIRSIIDLGNSKAVTIPKSWITNAEEKTGRKIIALALEIDGFITLAPVFEKASPDLALQQTRPAIKI
jgi:antitoxin component of MazEF toxin-antitoxin module